MKKSVWQKKYELLAGELRAMRLAAGLTQADLAKKLDKPQSYVSKYEGCDRYLGFIEVLEVCEACESDPTSLIQKLGFSVSQ
ncbi:helix-turn-helix domain-containing protein [Thiomicrorhabdus sp. 6S2-11]|uniref:Helix-turn-helix domain-containing protein n=1 Tax=Thiomicrorhabdus marina TaxID=2818442 RepID=A0ABS3Q2S3_9GAMM|nr:helix-turn-helix transcriptional regulator [Thiomicrorhabdus marina]MBO1926639.1 helix-turn-helix domain-containing protein [Thiomicrorhabdus marina]